MTEPGNKLFALNVYDINNLHIDKSDGAACYTVMSQVVFFTGPTAEYARNVYSEFLEPGWKIGAIQEVPRIEQLEKLGDKTLVCL